MDLQRRRLHHAPMSTPLSISERAKAVLDARCGERLTLRDLAHAVGASPFHLQRRFKQAFGLSPGDYQRERRLEEAKRQLASGRSVTEALFEAGYGSVSRFYEKAAARLGMAARAYRARGRGMRIAYTTFGSPLGSVLVAATARGICAVKLGVLAEAQFAEEFRDAERVRNASALAPARRAVLDFLRGDDSLVRLPLDVRGTAFQRKVWEALRAIPLGETRSYQQIAQAIGAPRAVRAVGSACGANPAALVIPCHRALRADGSPGGYAWGLARKRRILAIEKRARR